MNLWSVVFFFSSLAFAPANIPYGTVLPVQLNSSIHFNKAHPGQEISARIMQDVPLAAGGRIRAGARVIGHILAVSPATISQPAEVSLVFDTIAAGKTRISITTNLRALGSMMAVAQAQVPLSGPDRGTPSYWWTTEQIGGQINYHGDGATTENGQIVGHSTDGGVLVHPGSTAATRCGGENVENSRLQAFWVFSSNACGLYDYPDVILQHAGRTPPLGRIVLDSVKGNVNIRAGSGMLLRVIAVPRLWQ